MNILGSADFFGARDSTSAAHQLVDFSPIQEADQILEECQIFLQQAGDTSFALFPLLTRVQTVKNWRMKRRDNRLISVYETLYPRIIASEKKLRQIMGDVVEKKSEIRNQARHLQARLQACIRHNKANLQTTEGPVDELRLLINKLSGESAVMKEMIEFNKELLRFGTVEKVSKGQSFVRWGGAASKAPAKKVITESELQKDDTHPEIESKLVALRKLKEKFVACLSSVLEVRGTQLANLDNCEHSLKIINSIVNRSGIMAQQLDLGPPEESDGDGAVISSPYTAGGAGSGAGTGTNTPVDSKKGGQTSASPGGSDAGATTPSSTLQRTYTFDHSRCQDCSYGYMKTCDCTNHLNALQKQSLDANDRLQQLVEMRERVFEEAEKLIQAQGLDPASLAIGSKSSSASSFSEMMGGRKVDSPSGARSPSPSSSMFTPERASGVGVGSPPPGSAGGGTNLKAGIASEGVDDVRGHSLTENSEVDGSRR